METALFIAAFWFIFAAAFAMLVPAVGFRDDGLLKFYTHVHSCVIGGSCNAPRRSVHHVIEVIAWWIMRRDSSFHRVAAAYVVGFIAIALAPVAFLWGALEAVGRRLV